MKLCYFFIFIIVFLSKNIYAETFSGIDFPNGSISFADKVVSYEPSFGKGSPPTGKWLDSNQAIGIPDYTGGGSGDGAVSLGGGGRITLQFVNNALTGSNDDTPDLHIFEVGPATEDTFVEISKDGINFFSIGKVYGSTSSIDIDSFGFTSTDFFYYVRLTDDSSKSGTGSVGADIDAVGAISSKSISTNNQDSDNQDSESCLNTTISENLDIHIPSAIYQNPSVGETKLWVNFKYVPNLEGKLLFEISDYGVAD